MSLNSDSPSDSLLEPVLPYAGFWHRGAALWVDLVLYSLLGGMPILLLVLLLLLLQAYTVLLDSFDMTPIIDVLASLCDLIAYFGYFAWFDLRHDGVTPGRQLVGIALHSCDGQPITLSQSLIRQLGKLASALVLGIGYKVQPFTRRKQAWHDSWSRTVVVVSNAAVPTWLIWLLNGLGITLTLGYMAWVCWQLISAQRFAP